MEGVNNVMIDIETLGNKSNSLILSIGAIKFRVIDGVPICDDHIHVYVEPQSCVDAGLQMDVNTVMWWLTQSKEAQLGITSPTSPRISLVNALGSLSAFIGKDDVVWGNSARFDLGILSDAYNKVGMNIPWSFRNERCVRTLVAFAPEVKERFNAKGIAHDALQDANTQIGYCVEIWNKLKIKS